MRNRILVPLVVLVLALAAAGTAAAATGVLESNDSGHESARDVAERGTVVTQPTTSLPDSTLPEADNDVAGDNRTEDTSFVNLADGASQTFAAGQACSVTVQRNGNALTVLSVNAAAGFAGEVEQSAGTEVEVSCLDGTTRVDFNAELEDGVVRVRVRVRAPEVPDTTTPATAVADVPTTTPTTEPERVDNSGPGNANDDQADDDHSGPGPGGDDAENEPRDDSGHHGGGDDSGSDDSGHGGSGPD